MLSNRLLASFPLGMTSTELIGRPRVWPIEENAHKFWFDSVMTSEFRLSSRNDGMICCWILCPVNLFRKNIQIAVSFSISHPIRLKFIPAVRRIHVNCIHINSRTHTQIHNVEPRKPLLFHKIHLGNIIHIEHLGGFIKSCEHESILKQTKAWLRKNTHIGSNKPNEHTFKWYYNINSNKIAESNWGRLQTHFSFSSFSPPFSSFLRLALFNLIRVRVYVCVCDVCFDV